MPRDFAYCFGRLKLPSVFRPLFVVDEDPSSVNCVTNSGKLLVATPDGVEEAIFSLE